jgi:hypothetical protein
MSIQGAVNYVYNVKLQCSTQQCGKTVLQHVLLTTASKAYTYQYHINLITALMPTVATIDAPCAWKS